ncbi:MAG TPA: hypothetical protein IAB01_00560 [Candidatus Avidesulfovibrio excrementigallinarum]|nr:hypothetical protein [Candidatus Avidesulfovibrio excrementigallinarum]
MYLREKGQLILRVLHLVAISSWMGSVLCVLCLVHLAPMAGTDDELFGILRASVIINQYILVPVGAFGTFFTGLAYSMCTHRGFFRYTWIACKWIITMGMVLFGIVYLGPWAGQELDAVYQHGLAAYARPEIAAQHARRELACIVYAVLLLFSTALSVFRPWERPAAVIRR